MKRKAKSWVQKHLDDLDGVLDLLSEDEVDQMEAEPQPEVKLRNLEVKLRCLDEGLYKKLTETAEPEADKESDKERDNNDEERATTTRRGTT